MLPGAARLLCHSECTLGLLRCSSTPRPDFIFTTQLLQQGWLAAAPFMSSKFVKVREKIKKFFSFKKDWSLFKLSTLRKRARRAPQNSQRVKPNPKPVLAFVDRQQLQQLWLLSLSRGNISTGCADQLTRQFEASSLWCSGKDGGTRALMPSQRLKKGKETTRGAAVLEMYAQPGN